MMPPDRYSETLDAAEAILLREHPRASYALDVLHSRQDPSSADLKGKASKYGGSYARARSYALSAWKAAGGTEICNKHGKRLLAVEVGCDQDGRMHYDTKHNTYVQATKCRCALVPDVSRETSEVQA